MKKIDLKKRIAQQNLLGNTSNMNIRRNLIKSIDKIDNELLSANNQSCAGQRATNTYTFGECNKFGIYGIHTRFNDLHYFCVNVEEKDEYNLPLILCQFNSIDDVLDYLGLLDF
jgi:hypothetical protein